jgi:hypothetical protein
MRTIVIPPLHNRSEVWFIQRSDCCSGLDGVNSSESKYINKATGCW